MTKNKSVTLLDGRNVNCVHDIDEQGFILYALHTGEGDITSVSDAEYDNVEAQCVGEQR